MRYVYRDPARLRRHPVRVPELDPPKSEPAPEPTPPPAAPKPTPKPAPKRAIPRRDKPVRPLPPPVWGGRAGLRLATEESAALDRRTEALIAAGQDSPWIREYKRIHRIKT